MQNITQLQVIKKKKFKMELHFNSFVGIEMCCTCDEICVSLLLVSISCYYNYRCDGCFAEFCPKVMCVLLYQNIWLLM